MDERVPVTLAMADGRVLRFPVGVRTGPAFVALGVRKSGSSVFSNVVAALAKANAVPAVDIAGASFELGLRYRDWNEHPRLADLLWRGNAYVGFRDPPTGLYDDPVFAAARKTLLVRDPRDALVSEYFSNAYSHRLPGAGSVIVEERERALASDVESYALSRVEHLNQTVQGYLPLLGDPDLLLFRYEDVIADKATWLRAIAGHFGWEAPDALVSHILGWADIRPATEDPTRFVRRVTPGDHRDKLSPAGIAAIERQLSGVWERLGYG